jgi:alpha-D-ribose 1-methylphosphonate 5-triphosphate synthase subunit PhnH
VLLAFALLNADVSFHLVDFAEESADYLTANTRAPAAAGIAEATFVFANGETLPELLEGINCGSLPYPDTAATLVLQVAQLSLAPLSGGLKLELQGPGTNGVATVFVRGLNVDLLLAVQARNAEFPLGVDTFLTAEEGGRPSALGIPRSVKVAWEQC